MQYVVLWQEQVVAALKSSCCHPLLFLGLWGSKAATLEPVRDTAPNTWVACLVLKTLNGDELKMCKLCEEQLKS